MGGPEKRVELKHPGLPDDLVVCVGCGALVPDTRGPTNANIGASPGCWAIYERVRDRGIGDHRYVELQRLTIDTYAVQHMAVSKHEPAQAIAPQLVALCALIERGLPASVTIGAVRNAAKSRDVFEHISRPESCGELTILHVRDATTLQEHVRRVREWSSSVWKAWSPHHRVIRKWTDEAIRTAQPAKRPLLPRLFPTRRP